MRGEPEVLPGLQRRLRDRRRLLLRQLHGHSVRLHADGSCVHQRERLLQRHLHERQVLLLERHRVFGECRLLLGHVQGKPPVHVNGCERPQ